MVTSVVMGAALIQTREDARAYYEAKLARSHTISCYGRSVTIVFERGATHLYSVEWKVGEPEPLGAERVVRQLGGGREDVRRFSLARARVMDEVLPALSKFSLSTSGQNGNRLVFGPRRHDGWYMMAALRHGPRQAMTCVSAYLVEEYKWKRARASKAAKFPP